MKKFSICMPCFKTQKYLGRAIDSILDQRDYPEWEIIACLDGNENEPENKGWVEECEKILKEYSDPRIRYIKITHGGAPKARNEAAKLATGDFLAFWSSDFMAYPGMFTIWAGDLEAHPECGFAYGGYDLLEEGQKVQSYSAQPFDERQLEVGNYIDGGFPLRKEVYIPWDESIKSLQDWDFWLVLVKKGVKGYFMNNVTYAAEMPKAGGLSHDSASNWLERVETIKIKNHIPNRPVCITSLGAPFHAQRIAKLIDADFVQMPSFKPHKYRMVYLLGFYCTNVGHVQVFEGSGKSDSCVKAIHWIGTDVFILNSLKFSETRVMANDFFNKAIDYNIAEYDFTRKELTDLGIKSKANKEVPIMALPIEMDDEVYPLPDKFTVAVYAPATPDGKWKYQLDLMMTLARALPDIDFIFFGGNLDSELYNLKTRGWIKTKDVIKQSSMLMRFTVHDGLPASAVEFMMKGRQVLTNTPMPYAEWFSTMTDTSMCGIGKKDLPMVKDKLITRLRELKNAYQRKTYNWNEIQGYYRSIASPEYFKKQIDRMLNREPIEVLPTVDKFYVNGSLINGNKNGGATYE